MSEVDQVVVHLGLHKTATGMLQRQFFPACTDLNLLTTKQSQVLSFVSYVARTDPIYFDPDRARAQIRELLDNEKPNVLSNESLSGPPYAGVIEGGLDHRSPILENLKAVFPEAKAILVLRRQDALAKSLYRQYLKSGGTRSVRRFYGLGNKDHLPLFALDRFLFTPYVEAVHAAFPNGVLLLAFEDLIANQENFLQRISSFIGIKAPGIHLRKENATSFGPLGMEMSRLLNHIFRSLLNPGGIIPGFIMLGGEGSRRIKPLSILHDRWPGKGQIGKDSDIGQVVEEILAFSREDNRRLDAEFKLGLDKHHYY